MLRLMPPRVHPSPAPAQHGIHVHDTCITHARACIELEGAHAVVPPAGHESRVEWDKIGVHVAASVHVVC